MKFCSAYYSDTGKKETNQDSLLFIQSCQPQGDEIVLAVICDGVGGLKRGERASAEAVKAFRSGTTVEAVLFMKNQYYICHVGDCRTYIVSDTITQLTTDHTVVQRELTEGRLTLQQAQKDPRQSLLLQCVGAGKAVKPDFLHGEVQSHQSFLICCDGFRRRVTDDEIKHLCRYSTNEKKLRQSLEEVTRLCKKRKETDNITGILISAIAKPKIFFPFWKKNAQSTASTIKNVLLEHCTPEDKTL